MKTIIKKKVTRFGVDGKLYHNLTAAYRSIAMKELKAKVYETASQIAKQRSATEGVNWFGECTLDDIDLAYQRMFPHSPEKLCAKSYRWPYDEKCSCNPFGGFAYSWCKTARERWIKNRIEELKKECEVISK